MGLLDRLVGNASEIVPASLEGDFARVLAGGERIEKAYRLVRNLFVFMSKRLNTYDVQSVPAGYVLG